MKTKQKCDGNQKLKGKLTKNAIGNANQQSKVTKGALERLSPLAILGTTRLLSGMSRRADQLDLSFKWSNLRICWLQWVALH